MLGREYDHFLLSMGKNDSSNNGGWSCDGVSSLCVYHSDHVPCVLKMCKSIVKDGEEGCASGFNDKKSVEKVEKVE